MPRRTRTAKKLAQRITLDYFKGQHWFRTWRKRLLIGVPLLVAPWVIGTAVSTKTQSIYTPGPLSSFHTMFNARCDACHQPQAGRIRRRPTDASCISCHDGPIHSGNETSVSQCVACHFEHQGRMQLSRETDKGCTDCHAVLRTRSGKPQFQNVSGFRPGQHPEFAAKRSGVSDPGRIKYSHAAHAELKRCQYCHTTSAITAPEKVAGLSAGGSRRSARTIQGAYMAKVRFADHCLSCHRDKMVFERKVLRQVPHDTPQVIHDAIMKQPTAGTVDVAALEAKLWKKCEYCHTLQYSSEGLPNVVFSSIPERWFTHAAFTHDPHQAFACESCHVGASASKSERDILLPNVATCQTCHLKGGAAFDCSECHSYHDWTKERALTVLFDSSCLQGNRPIAECRVVPQEKTATEP